MEDAQLLHAYATQRSEEAFRELVRRHLPVVHGVARRQAGVNEHLADDVAQRVFFTLARKASALRNHASLVGWLYTAARFEAARAVRAEARRRTRETQADMMNSSDSASSSEISWEQLKPELDAAMAQLGERDREAVLLRYFSGKSFGEVGQVFAVSEEAARKRVDRAVDKLRDILGRRGIVSSSLALGSALGAHAAPAVSESTLATIATAPSQQACAVGPAISFSLYMGSTKTVVAVASAVIVLAGALVIRDAQLAHAAQEARSVAHAELSAQTRAHTRVTADLAAAQQQRRDADAQERDLIYATPNSARPYLQNPEYRELFRASAQARRHLEFQRFYRQLKLTPEQIERFEAIMARQDEANLDGQIARDLGRDEQAIFRKSGPEWDSAMRELLGHDGKRQLELYLRTTAVRAFIDAIAARSYAEGEPITLEQSDRMAEIALAHDPTFQSGKGTDPGKVSWNEVWAPAAKVLSPNQLMNFETAVEVWSLQKRISLAKKAGTPDN